MLPYIHQDTPFPPVNKALAEPNGLLAIGGDLSASRLISAYSQGIFPWFSEDEPLMWWSPDPRTVFLIDRFKVKKSVKKTLRENDLKLTLNHAFDEVILNCSLPRSKENGTWITDEMIEAYTNLHRLNRAHSVEVWLENDLVGGIYGVNVGGVFCGESMFSRISNGSKIALSSLILYLRTHGFELIDCQVENPHLVSLGALNISRELYIQMLESNQCKTFSKSIWVPKKLDFNHLLTSK